MNYKIINTGGSRDVFVGKEKKQFFIQRHEIFPTTNLDFAKEAAKLPHITYEVVEPDKRALKQEDTSIAEVVRRIPHKETSVTKTGFMGKLKNLVLAT